MLTIHYFASIRETLEKSGEELTLPAGVESVADLMSHLANGDDRFDALLAADRKVLVAVNQTVVGTDHKLSANDEVAFFPPMTGG